MIGLATAIEQLTLQRDGFAGAVNEWQRRCEEIEAKRLCEGMELRDLLGQRDHEIVLLTRANRELTEKVRKLERRTAKR